MNKKGNALSIIVWIVGVFVIVFFLAGWLYMHNALTNVLTSVPFQTSAVNITYAVQNTIVPINNAMNALHYISFILITMLAFAILVENFYIRKHPVLFVVHLFIVLVAIAASIYISNYYESLLASGNILSSTLGGFTAVTYIILYLPWWVAVIGIFGIILLVINALRDPEIKGSAGI